MDTIIQEPIDTSREPITMIWLHGLGVDGSDFESFQKELAQFGELNNVRMILPSAPERIITTYNMKMTGWYDFFQETFDEQEKEDLEGMNQSAETINAIIAQAREAHPNSPIWLGGFSQGAAMALMDEDQEDALKELIHEMTSLYIRIIDKCCTVYNLDGFQIHDDWGSQMAPFFSEKIARTFFLPEMKRLVDHVHEKKMYIELHSCGHLEKRCNIFVEAGFDAWHPMPMNDTVSLFETYGDKIMIGVVNDKPFPPDASEEEQRACAREFAQRFCKPGKPVSFSLFYNDPSQATPAFREELYKVSRELYAQF